MIALQAADIICYESIDVVASCMRAHGAHKAIQASGVSLLSILYVHFQTQLLTPAMLAKSNVHRAFASELHKDFHADARLQGEAGAKLLGDYGRAVPVVWNGLPLALRAPRARQHEGIQRVAAECLLLVTLPIHAHVITLFGVARPQAPATSPQGLMALIDRPWHTLEAVLASPTLCYRAIAHSQAMQATGTASSAPEAAEEPVFDVRAWMGVATRMASELAQGLSFLHSKFIVVRNVRSSTVYVSPSWTIRVGDLTSAARVQLGGVTGPAGSNSEMQALFEPLYMVHNHLPSTVRTNRAAWSAPEQLASVLDASDGQPAPSAPPSATPSATPSAASSVMAAPVPPVPSPKVPGGQPSVTTPSAGPIFSSFIAKAPSTTLPRAPSLSDPTTTHLFAADVYSYAIVMWEIATRAVPWEDLSNHEIVARVASGERPPTSDISDVVYSKIMQQCWATAHSDRPRLSRVVVALGGESSLSHPSEPCVSSVSFNSKNITIYTR